MITLEDIKNRPLNPETVARMEHTKELAQFNIYARRCWMNNREIDWLIGEMVRDGNVPKSNDEMLDDARMFYEKRVYTDDEWESYFLPAINAMISYNNSFVRWFPGYIIREKRTGRLCILMYDYGMAYGGRDYTNLSVLYLNNKGIPAYTSAWRDYDSFELIDCHNTCDNIAKIRAFLKGQHPHYNMRGEICRLLYDVDSPPERHKH